MPVAVPRASQAGRPLCLQNPMERIPSNPMSQSHANHRFLPVAEEVVPADQAALAEAVSRAHRAGTPVYPVGGGTMLYRGGRPERPGMLVHLAQLNRLLVHTVEDLTITVEAGMTMAELASHLAAHRQCLPVDVPFASQATVGGWIMTNLAGPRRFAHGTAGDYLLGFRAVDGAGMSFAGGAKVVKNAAGYNMPRLLVGSLGTLAVLTEATLRVKPLPETGAFALCQLPDWNSAEALLASLVQSQTEPTAVELVVGAQWSARPPFSGHMSGNETPMWLAVGFEGTSAEVEWMLGQLEQEWNGQLGKSATCRVDDHGVTPLLRDLTEYIWEAPASHEEAFWIAEVHVLPAGVVEVVRCLHQQWPESTIVSRAGDGMVLARIPANGRVEPATVRQALASPLRAGCGTLAIHCLAPQVELTALETWGGPPPAAGLMAELKRRFDPKNILNPGRLPFAQ